MDKDFVVGLIFTTLWANSADDKLIDNIFLIFARKTEFDTSCKLSPLETICMKCQTPFSRENKKKCSICRLLKILQC